MGHERVIGVKIAGLSLLFVVSRGEKCQQYMPNEGKMPQERQTVAAVSTRWTKTGGKNKQCL